MCLLCNIDGNMHTSRLSIGSACFGQSSRSESTSPLHSCIPQLMRASTRPFAQYQLSTGTNYQVSFRSDDAPSWIFTVAIPYCGRFPDSDSPFAEPFLRIHSMSNRRCIFLAWLLQTKLKIYLYADFVNLGRKTTTSEYTPVSSFSFTVFLPYPCSHSSSRHSTVMATEISHQTYVPDDVRTPGASTRSHF